MTTLTINQQAIIAEMNKMSIDELVSLSLRTQVKNGTLNNRQIGTILKMSDKRLINSIGEELYPVFKALTGIYIILVLCGVLAVCL